MKTDELYPELLGYIFNCCGSSFLEKVLKAYKQLQAMERTRNGANVAMYKVLKQRGAISLDQDILDLTKDGFDVYKQRVARRICAEHKDELELNLCPRCGKIARTPLAK